MHRLALAPVALAAVLLAACSSSDPDPAAAALPASTPAPVLTASPAADPFLVLEARHHARLGVYALDPVSGRTVTHRAGERFAFASTGKVLSAGVLLKQASDPRLAATVTYRAADILPFAPVTKRHLDTGMPLRDLLAAALQYSDNTAANLLLRELGGPAQVQDGLRALGDSTTHVDRTEPELNTATPGDLRDTTTPEAIATDLRLLVLGDALAPDRRQLLTTLMTGNTTGGPYVRAGLPAGWTVADKTGSGGHGTRNDVAVVWRPDGRPLVLALLSDRGTAEASYDETLLAEATQTLVPLLE